MTHRRITDLSIAEGETGTVAPLIAGRQRCGVIEGVEVDFRHPDLPADDWEARPFWYVWGESPSHAGIIFPYEAAYGVAELRKLKAIDDSVPAVFALVGDKITVESVVPKIEDRRFDHPHDAQQRLAYLRIERPSGEVRYPAGPLTFYGTSQIKNGALRETFDHIVTRIVRQPTGIQRAYLDEGGAKAKFAKVKLPLGRVSGGAIRLGPVCEQVTVCEGLEDGLSLAQPGAGSVWVAAGASMLPAMQFPPAVRSVVIGADGDEAREREALKAGAAYAARGISVRIIRPLAGFKDFNAELQGAMS